MILQLFDQIAKSGKLPPTPPGLYETATDPTLIARAAERRELTPIETGGADWRAADGFDRMNDLERIQVPALIVAGTNDLLTPPKYAEYMAAHLAQSKLHILDGAGHMLVLERAEELAKGIEEFVGGLG